MAAEVVTLVATDGAVVSALLELDFTSCCPPFLSNITSFFVCAQAAIVGVVTLVVSVAVVVAVEVVMVAVLMDGGGEGVAVAVAGGADSVTGGEI